MRTIPVCPGHLSGICAASGQNLVSNKQDQGPAKGSGIHAANAIGSTWHILQSSAHPEGTAAEGAEQARHGEHSKPYLGAGSTSWTGGTWQGLGGESAIRAPCHSPDCSHLPSLAPWCWWQSFPICPYSALQRRLGQCSKRHSPWDQLFLEIPVDLGLLLLPVRRQDRFPFLCMF